MVILADRLFDHHGFLIGCGCGCACGQLVKASRPYLAEIFEAGKLDAVGNATIDNRLVTGKDGLKAYAAIGRTQSLADPCHSLRSLDPASGGAPIAPHIRPQILPNCGFADRAHIECAPTPAI